MNTRAEKDADLPPMHSITFKLDDPSGNSCFRMLEQNIALGLVDVDDEVARDNDEMKQRVAMQAQAQFNVVGKVEEVVGEDRSMKFITDDEILVFPAQVMESSLRMERKLNG